MVAETCKNTERGTCERCVMATASSNDSHRARALVASTTLRDALNNPKSSLHNFFDRTPEAYWNATSTTIRAVESVRDVLVRN